MIVTLTANPSLDRTIELGGPLARGEVHRATATHEQPGGKGVNVSRALIASGIDTIALLPGNASDPMLVALRGEGIPAASVPIAGRIRSNVTLTEPDGTTTKLNEPGPALLPADEDALIELVLTHARDAAWLVLAGSLPPGLSPDFYARVIRAVRADGARNDAAPDGVRRGGIRIAVDSSEAPLAALIASGVGVDLVKPNAEELSGLTGRATGDELESDPEAAYSAAADVVEQGARAVLATLGAKGAVLATADGGWFATMPPIVARSTVGAGDASLAGFLVADLAGGGPERLLAQAVASGSAAASLPGSTMPRADQTAPDRAIIQPLVPVRAAR